MVPELLGLEDRSHWHERDLEQANIDRLETFLLELGKGFCFVSISSPVSFTTYTSVDFKYIRTQRNTLYGFLKRLSVFCFSMHQAD